jgi:hypothetical protein
MKDDDQERIKAYMAAKMAHIKMYNECMNLADGLDVAKFAELVRADEREACAKICDAQAEKDNFEGCYANACAEAIRARSEKPPVKSYCGGKPNYCTPVDAVNISAERVDETAKHEHEPWCDSVTKLLLSMPPQIPPCNCKPKCEWVGLDGEIPGLGLVTEEFYNGMLFAEDILRKKNT